MIDGKPARGPRERDRAVWQAYLPRRYAVLFYSLLLMLVATPVGPMIGLPQTSMKLLLGACLLAAVLPRRTQAIPAIFT